MMDAQRALLDELMGSARNLTEEEKKGYRELHWDDREVCGCYLVRFCPHDLFVNTKSDLGPCRKVHDPKLKESFEKSTRHDLYSPRFEAELAHFCEKLVQDLDRKLRRGRERLAQEDMSSAMLAPTEKTEQLAAIEEKIKKLLEQIESLGEEGKVDEAQALMKKVDVLGAEKTAMALQANDDKGLVMSQEKKMALCEICGSFLVANDAAERTQSHVTGKQHVGYGMVRDFIDEYKALKEKKEEERLAEEKEKEEMRKQRERDQETETGKDDGRERGREERDRHGDVERDRPREQWQRGRNRDTDRYGLGREGRERDREKYRERGRDSRDRDGDRVREPDRVRKRSRSPYRTGHLARTHIRRY